MTQRDKVKAIADLGEDPAFYRFNKVPSSVMDKLSTLDMCAIYFLIQLKKIDDGFDESEYSTFYLHALIYVQNGSQCIKNLYTGKTYSLDDFLTCFDLDFDKNTIAEKSTYDRHLIDGFLPCNTLYGNKSLVPVYFYTPSKCTLSFYTNRQYTQSIAKPIPNLGSRYVRYDELPSTCYYADGVTTKMRIHASLFTDQMKYMLIEDEYTLVNNQITQVTINSCETGTINPLEPMTIATDTEGPLYPQLNSERRVINYKKEKSVFGFFLVRGTWHSVFGYVNLGYNRDLKHCSKMSLYLQVPPLYQISDTSDPFIQSVIGELEEEGYSKQFGLTSKDFVVLIHTFQFQNPAEKRYVLLCMNFVFDSDDNFDASKSRFWYAQDYDISSTFDITRYARSQCNFTIDRNETNKRMTVYVTIDNETKPLFFCTKTYWRYYPDVDIWYNHGTAETAETATKFVVLSKPV